MPLSATATNPTRLKEVIEFVRASDGLQYAKDAMLDYRSQAFELLGAFPDSPVKQSLTDLVQFVTDREK